jgi:hypothetical protein
MYTEYIEIAHRASKICRGRPAQCPSPGAILPHAGCEAQQSGRILRASIGAESRN